MKRKGYSVSSLCRAADIDRPNFSKWLNSTSKDISLKTLNKVLLIVCPEHTSGVLFPDIDISLSEFEKSMKVPKGFRNAIQELKQIQF